MPDTYEWIDTEFGAVIVKAYTETTYNLAHAKSLCSNDASYLHLPVPTNEAQNQWYLEYAQKFGLGDYWLGINDSVVEGEWRTNNGDPQNFLKWAPGQPDNREGKEHYVIGNKVRGWWYDVIDRRRFHVICTFIIPEQYQN